VVALTGTNGKTTTAWLVEQALAAVGRRPGRAGTIGYSFAGLDYESSLTTPQADDLSRFAAGIARHQGTHLVMEASSHALEQHRLDALRIRAAGFTNLTQDHLDYHRTMEAYAAAKLRLFTEFGAPDVAINVDDPWGVQLAHQAVGRVLRVSRLGKGDVRADAARFDASGLVAEVTTPSRTFTLRSRLVGEHNLDNLLLAIGLLEALGLPVEEAAEAWRPLGGVPGRLERCDTPEDDVLVLVDYAHTPDALVRVLQATRPLTRGEVICVFGCGGDRDPGKRPKMGAAVAAGAHRAILTNDNPRTESPEAIAAMVEPGLRQGAIPYVVELDRARAIEQAILGAKPGDVVLVAGKGHENYQIFGTQKTDFDDRVECRRALAARRGGAQG